MTENFAILDSNGSIVLCRATHSVTSDPIPCKMFPGPDFPPENTSILPESVQASIETSKRALGEKDTAPQQNNVSVTFLLRLAN